MGLSWGTYTLPLPAKFNSSPQLRLLIGLCERAMLRNDSEVVLECGQRVTEAASTSPPRGCSLRPALAGWLAGSQPPSFLLTGNDFLSLCSHFLCLPNWIWVSDLPSGGGRMGVEGLLGSCHTMLPQPPHHPRLGELRGSGTKGKRQQALLKGPDRALKIPSVTPSPRSPPLHDNVKGGYGCPAANIWPPR